MYIDSHGRRMLLIPHSVSIADLWNGGLTTRLGLEKTVTAMVQAPLEKEKKPQGLKTLGRRRRLDSVVAAKPYESKLTPKERSFEADMNARVTEVDDEGAELSTLGEDIKICSLNINGLKVDKVKYIAWYVRRHNIDVLFLQDTQLTVQRRTGVKQN